MLPYDIHQFPDRVTRGEDGVYRWKYLMNPRRNKHALIVMGQAFLMMAALSTVALLIVGPPSHTMSPWSMPLMVAGMFLGVYMLIVGILFLAGDDPLPFSMDEEKIITFRAKAAGPHLFRWVRRVKLLPQYDAIRLGFALTVYVPAEDYEAVKAFILDRLPPEARVE